MIFLEKLEKIFSGKKTSRTFVHLNDRFEKRRQRLSAEFIERNQEVHRWLESKGIDVDELVARGSRSVLATVAAGMMMMSIGIAKIEHNQKVPAPELEINKIIGEVRGKQVVDKEIAERLKRELTNKNSTGLTKDQEVKITQALSDLTGIKIVSELDGNRLNTNYGKIGLEQHLPRYPGEKIEVHFDSVAARQTYGRSGMTANRGAFGYFAPSKFALTREAIEKEKYYVVVQTFDSPGWGKKRGLVEWYRHRKVIVVNPTNGKAIIGDIADSGPAKFTKKSFGGSPELMHNLGLYGGPNKGAVLLFFIDDLDIKVKLGPI